MAAKSPIPEGAEDTVIDYYDIMIIGRTGMGKSTTADKLIIANPDGHDYRGEQHVDEIVTVDHVKMSDLSMWLIADAEGETNRVVERLKNLVRFRSLDDSHKEVNQMYRRASNPTTGSQVVSNDTTRLRVLDVPGFFGMDIATTASGRKTSTGDRVTRSGLLIMREVLRIQASMRMKFRRIIYFIPERGTLERSHKVLMMELEQLGHYFGKSIFECMVLVATESPDVYKYLPENVTPFDDEASTATKASFEEALVQVLPDDELLPDDKPPIVFISMHDTCERILEKIKRAPVVREELRLEFDHRTCICCGLRAKILKYKNGKRKRVACYVGDNPSGLVPYEESCCHPLIISKYWTITKIVGGIAHFITRKKYEGKWPNFRNPDDEVCIDCGKPPSDPGCKKVGSRYKIAGVIFVVDHTPIDPVAAVEQPGGEIQIAIRVEQEETDNHPHRDLEQTVPFGAENEADGMKVEPGQQQQPGGGSSPAAREGMPPVVQGERSQTLQITADVEPQQRQLDVETSLKVGTPDQKG